MLRFPHISQCVDLAMNIGVWERFHVGARPGLLCDLTSCLLCSLRARLLQSVCEAAHREEAVPALLSESARPAELHFPPRCSGTAQTYKGHRVATGSTGSEPSLQAFLVM